VGGLFHLGVPWYELVIRSVGIYFVLLLGLRVFGKREVGQFTLFDLVFVLLVANAVQPAMTGPDASLLGGVIIVLSLLSANWLVGRLDDIPALHRLLTPPPTVLFKDGKPLEWQMRREGITLDEIEMAMREHGLEKLAEVKLAVLEPDGSISIIGKDEKVQQRRRRRVRFIRHAD
jgi:uncharacterized membrane protein YcaP (DUF421 family)